MNETRWKHGPPLRHSRSNTWGGITTPATVSTLTPSVISAELQHIRQVSASTKKSPSSHEKLRFNIPEEDSEHVEIKPISYHSPTKNKGPAFPAVLVPSPPRRERWVTSAKERPMSSYSSHAVFQKFDEMSDMLVYRPGKKFEQIRECKHIFWRRLCGGPLDFYYQSNNKLWTPWQIEKRSSTYNKGGIRVPATRSIGHASNCYKFPPR